MSNSKQMDIIRKRNKQLSQELEELKNKIKLNENIDVENIKRADDLISQLNDIKNEWQSALDRVRKCQEQYNELIETLCNVKDIFIDSGFIKIPWYKKLLIKFKKDK